MDIFCFESSSFDGNLVRVEVDIRKGIPGLDIIGLPDGAVLESRERLRAAMRNSGYEIPKGRILINLAPAGIKKAGASFDLSMATAILLKSGEINLECDKKVLILGELMLSGEIRSVNGVLSAVAASINSEIDTVIVPDNNLREALSLEGPVVYGIDNIKKINETLASIVSGESQNIFKLNKSENDGYFEPEIDFKDIRGLPFVKRAIEVAAAGRHNVLLFGPPGGGKTISCRAISGILPSLSREEAIEVTRIYSAAGLLKDGMGLITRPPFRQPHHSASEEGVIGGGKIVRPGEISLAHKGVLFLDETPEFSKHLLQALREPVEEGKVDIARAGRSCLYPADFQLILAANPCPCGNLGKKEAVCLCSRKEVINYWKRLGGALLDRIDIRIPVEPEPLDFFNEDEEASCSIRKRVEYSVKIQERRYINESFNRNARISQKCLKKYCVMNEDAEYEYMQAVKKLRISSRACVSIIKIARTIADLKKNEKIETNDIFEAIQHRRYGESDFYWDKM
ncbi:MAG: YifB family Mg chelatase-like AAA ATPase [Spirochaetales bacterium]|nr:YifB family Mg chelatase-like AAA ATPase [Spirochaetales bacterium]